MGQISVVPPYHLIRLKMLFLFGVGLNFLPGILFIFLSWLGGGVVVFAKVHHGTKTSTHNSWSLLEGMHFLTCTFCHNLKNNPVFRSVINTVPGQRFESLNPFCGLSIY